MTIAPGDRVWKEVWAGPSFATTLFLAFIDRYGDHTPDWDPKKIDENSCLYWSADTINYSIETDFGVQMPQANLDRLMTAILLQTTNHFYRSLPAFIEICNVLSGDTYDHQLWSPAGVEEIAWALVESSIIEPDDDAEEFDPEIVGYIAQAMAREGLVSAPDVLQFAASGVGSNVEANFSDDPEMLSNLYTVALDRTSKINQFVSDNFAHLIEQLKHLPLRHGVIDNFLSLFSRGT